MIIAFPSLSCAVWTKNIWSTLSPPWCGRGLENSRLGPAVQERGIWLAFPTSSLLACKLCFFCKTLPNALSTLQEMFPIVSQTHFFAGGTNWKKNSLSSSAGSTEQATSRCEVSSLTILGMSEMSNVLVKSKLQNPPSPGQPSGHLNFWKIFV